MHIWTRFCVLRAPESWSKKFGLFLTFFLLILDIFYFSITSISYRDKIFVCDEYPIAGRDTQPFDKIKKVMCKFYNSNLPMKYDEMYSCINRNARPNNNQLITYSYYQTCQLLTNNTIIPCG